MKVKIILIITVIASLLTGCATKARRYTIKETIKGQEVKVDVLEIDGIGEAEYKEGDKIKGKPMIQFPQPPPIKYKE